MVALEVIECVEQMVEENFDWIDPKHELASKYQGPGWQRGDWVNSRSP